jgi:hypothetical protein
MTYPYPAGQYPAAGVAAPPAHHRGRKPLWAALITFVIAVVLFAVGGFVVGTKALGKVNDFQRVAFSSGSGTVTLNGTGKWIGYYEAGNVSNSIDRIPDFRVAVTSPSGQNVTFQPYGNRGDGKVKKLTYDHNGHKGAAAFQFTATEKGTYRIRLAAVDSLPSDADVAIGRDIAGGTIVGGALILGGVLFIVAAIVLLIVGLVKRSRHKTELAAGGYYGGGYGGAVPAPQWPPAPQQWQPGQQQPWPAGQQQQWPIEQQQQPQQQSGQWPQQPPPGSAPPG